MNYWLNEYAQFKADYPELGGWLLCLVKSTAILALTAATASLLRNQSARAQNWVWRCGLAVLLVLSIWQTIPQKWIGGMFAWKTSPIEAAAPSEIPLRTAATAISAPDAQMTTTDMAGSATDSSLLGTLEAFVTPMWWVAASVLAVFYLARSIGAARWLRLHSNAMSGSSEYSQVEVRVCSLLPAPILTGLIRPLIHLPKAAAEWNEEKRDYVFSHEMAHWNRGDVAWQIAGKLTCCLWWWNPLAWVAFRQLKSTAEQATDDLVILRKGDPDNYARCLVEIASIEGPRPALSMSVPMLGQSSLETRIRRILSPNRFRNTLGMWSASVLSMLLVLTVLCAGANVALGEATPAVASKTPHYQAKLENNVLPQGEFARSKGQLQGWTGSLSTASFPEGGVVRIKPGTEEAILETKISRQPAWEWLTVIVRTRPAPGTTMSDHQGAISFLELDGSGKILSTPVTFEQSKRTGYVNWGNGTRTFRLSPEAKEIAVRMQLSPGPGELDCSEIYVIPSKPEDEMDSALVDRFYKSVRDNDLVSVKQQLAAEPRLVNARNGSADNGTPLIVCAWNELPDMAQLLIDNGAEVNALDTNWKATALAWCGWWGSPKTAEVLLKAGADPKFRSVYGVTPLSSAKAGKKGNTFSKNSPEDYDRVIAIFEK